MPPSLRPEQKQSLGHRRRQPAGSPASPQTAGGSPPLALVQVKPPAESSPALESNAWRTSPGARSWLVCSSSQNPCQEHLIHAPAEPLLAVDFDHRYALVVSLI